MTYRRSCLFSVPAQTPLPCRPPSSVTSLAASWCPHKGQACSNGQAFPTVLISLCQPPELLPLPLCKLSWISACTPKKGLESPRARKITAWSDPILAKGRGGSSLSYKYHDAHGGCINSIPAPRNIQAGSLFRKCYLQGGGMQSNHSMAQFFYL